MGLFARLTCIRHDGIAKEFVQTVRDLLPSRNLAETPDASTAERLLMIAPAGDGWLVVIDHVENLSASMEEADGLLAELNQESGRITIDILVADSDDLILQLMDGGVPQSQLVIDRRGLKGALEPWRKLLLPGRSVEDIRKAFTQRPALIEQHFPSLKPLFGVDFTAFEEILSGGLSLQDDAVLLRLKAVPTPGHLIGPPQLEVDDRQRQNHIINRSFPHIPLGLVTHFPAFCFHSRGGGARGLNVRLMGSALDLGLIKIVSATLRQDRPTDPKLSRATQVAPEMTPDGILLRFPEFEVPDWVRLDRETALRAHGSLHDLRVFVYARGVTVGDGELLADAQLVEPESATVQTSYPVVVLPAMWHPLKGSDQPSMVHYVRALNDPARINGLAVLRGGPNETASVLRRAIEIWKSLAAPGSVFTISAATEPAYESNFFRPADIAASFKLDLSKKRNAKWDRLMTDLPAVQGLRIASDPGIGRSWSPAEHAERFAARASLHYLSPASHPRLPAYASRLGHVSLSLPNSPTGASALISFMRTLANDRMICQAYVGAWAHEDDPNSTVYEWAADIFVHQRTAQGWGAHYLRAVSDRLWLGPEFAEMLPDRAALERVAVLSHIGNALAIERRPGATLRDIELCLEPMLPSKTESQAFWDLFRPRPQQP